MMQIASLVLTMPLMLAGQQDLGVKAERDVPVTMRDGVVLRADVFRPDSGGPYPVLVQRTPYSKAGRNVSRLVKAGYIVVTQDARGRYKSDGTYESFVRFKTHDGMDGYDTVEWAAKLPGSTGKVGTFGSSYNAFLQWRLAALRPPSLVCMAAFTIPARYLDLEGPGAIRPGRRLHWWVTTMTPDLRKRAGRPGTHTPADARELWSAGEGESWLRFLPYLDLPRRAFEEETAAVHYWLKNPHTDPWKLHEAAPDISVPNFDMIGWYDHCNGDMLLFRSMVRHGRTETARKGQRMIVGPWRHGGWKQRKYGDIDFGPAAVVDFQALQIRWFDYWLKGKQNGVDTDSPVRIFVMGANRWRDENEWPLSRAETVEMYLAGNGKANSPAGDGRIVPKPVPSQKSDRFTYDPRDPVPTLYRPALVTIPTDQRPLAGRQDILVYQSEPLTQPLEVTGNPTVELYASSSAQDTDFFVRLIDVSPDGLARDVSLGMVRARYRNSLEKPELLTPGKITKFVIRMNPTSNEFQPGHRIRLDITSSDFPNYDRNHNTAADQNADAVLDTAAQTVYHGGAHATKILLPVIR